MALAEVEISLPHNWVPRAYQCAAWDALEQGINRALLVWHRRAGKDEVCLHHAARMAFQKIGNYWHMLPEASQSRKAIWDAVNPHSGLRRIDEAFPLDLRENTRENEMSIRFVNGSQWQVVGSDNYHSLIGSPPVGIVFSEWARADPQSWAYLRPILAENGGWAIFVTTPFGHNHAKTMFDAYQGDAEWFIQRLSAEDTGALDTARLKQEKREYVSEFGLEIGGKLFEQEYLCSFDAPILGAYYADLINQAEQDDRITDVPFDPSCRVETWWDIGKGDGTAIWFVQRKGLTFRVIDYYEASGVGAEHYAKVLDDKAKAGKWLYSAHVWPHDGKHGTWDTGDTTRDRVFERLSGLRPSIVPRGAPEDGIQAGRSILPLCWFDKVKTERGVNALRQHRAEYDERRKALKISPLHDWTSEAADAWRTGAKYKPPGIRPPRAAGDMAPKLATV